MDRQALRERLMTTFLGELEDHVQAVRRDALAAEHDPAQAAERVPSLLRTAHSLKGAARAVSLPAIEAACHQLETLLGAVRDGRRSLDTERIQLLFTTADALSDAASRLRTGGSVDAETLDGLLLALRRASVIEPAPARPPESRPADTPPPARAQPAHEIRQRDTLVRVPSEKLDALLAGSGELLVARRRVGAEQAEVTSIHVALRACRAEWRRLESPLRSRLRTGTPVVPRRAVTALDRTGEQLEAIERRVDQLSMRMAAAQRALERAAGVLDDEIRRVRLFPFGLACDRLAMTVRDLSRRTSKQIDLIVTGGDIQLDRFVLEAVADPLLQLVRNAIVHGIETPAQRDARGKPPRGTIVVAATLRGDAVEIVVQDDGRGLDLDDVRSLARRRGVPEPTNERDAAALVLRPGFSTAAQVTPDAGRGVGLDIVRHGVESIQGHLDVSFEAGQGLRAALTFPLTLTTVRALLVKAAGQLFAIPIWGIHRLVRASAAELSLVDGRDMLRSDGARIPAVSLPQILGIDAPPTGEASGRIPFVLMRTGRGEAAIAVQELLTEDEVLVKGLGPRLKHVPHLAGAAVLPSGQLALILNAADVVHTALTLHSTPLAVPLAQSADRRRRRVLLVDDSVTTRSLERSILETAGYDVRVAVDGSHAWQLLQQHGADVVVADVEMPRMNGLALCEAIRGATRFRGLPVILVTALDSERDRQRGLDAGANAYLPKTSFDQRRLLDTVARLL